MVQANRCEVCSHIWVSDAILQSVHIQVDEPTRMADEIGLPIRCAKCKSPYWNRAGGWIDELSGAKKEASTVGADEAGDTPRRVQSRNSGGGKGGRELLGLGNNPASGSRENGESNPKAPQAATGKSERSGEVAIKPCPDCGALRGNHFKGCKQA